MDGLEFMSFFQTTLIKLWPVWSVFIRRHHLTGRVSRTRSSISSQIAFHRFCKASLLSVRLERSVRMKSTSYRELDYAFGQAMLTLRTACGLTQAGLADLLGVSRQAVVGWEDRQQLSPSQASQTFPDPVCPAAEPLPLGVRRMKSAPSGKPPTRRCSLTRTGWLRS